MGIKFDAISLFVNDLKVMVEFYRDVLGVDIEWDGTGPHVEFKHEGIRFMMYERKELAGYLGKEVSYPNGINGTFELAIDLPCFADVDREFERVVKMAPNRFLTQEMNPGECDPHSLPTRKAI